MNPSAHRLFFALWPDAQLRVSLHGLGRRMCKALGGHVVAAHRLHLTLAFLGSVPVARINELRTIGEVIDARRFALDLAQTGCWKRTAVGWIAPMEVPKALEQLVSELRRRLLEAGFRADEKPFRPHVTLLRKARCEVKPEPVEPPCRWQVTDYCLIRSQTLPTGPDYGSLMSWRLR